MYYKSSDIVTDSQPNSIGDGSIDKMPSEKEDREDSGLGSLEFHSSSTLEMTSMTSSVLDSIQERGCEEDTEMNVDNVDTINGNFSRMSLEDGKRDSGENTDEKQHIQCDIETDSGHYESITSDTGATNISACSCTSVENSVEVTSPSEWMSIICQRCISPQTGEVVMDQVVGLFQGNQDGDNLLNLFIIHELVDPALLLINLAPDFDWLNLHNNIRQTPLHLAVMTRQPAIVRPLICAGASVTEQDLLGNTPLHWACAMGCEDIVRHFLQPVRHSETVQTFYKCPFQVLPQVSGLRNFNGDTCLHLAAKEGHVNVVRLLLEYGFDPNVGDGKTGRTVLHHAAEAGHMELTSLLLAQRRTQCDQEDYGRHTAHDLARGQQQSQVMRLLVCHGAKPSMTIGRRSSDSDDDDDDDIDCDGTITNGHCSG